MPDPQTHTACLEKAAWLRQAARACANVTLRFELLVRAHELEVRASDSESGQASIQARVGK